MSAAEQFILTLSENGYGKRSSSYSTASPGAAARHRRDGGERPATGRWSRPSRSMSRTRSCWVTDGGQLIRCPVNGIRIVGRGSQGVIVFDTAEDEKVVSVERVSEEVEPEGDEMAPE